MFALNQKYSERWSELLLSRSESLDIWNLIYSLAGFCMQIGGKNVQIRSNEIKGKRQEVVSKLKSRSRNSAPWVHLTYFAHFWWCLLTVYVQTKFEVSSFSRSWDMSGLTLLLSPRPPSGHEGAWPGLLLIMTKFPYLHALRIADWIMLESKYKSCAFAQRV